MTEQQILQIPELTTTQNSIQETVLKNVVLVGNRIPKDFFITSGIGESDITIHAGSYHLALKSAGIEGYNHITYSSILPPIANEIAKPESYVHGSVMESITAVANSKKWERATAAIIFGWLFNKKTGEKFGGLVCEYNGHDTRERAEESLRASLNELYENGFSEEYTLEGIKFISRSFIPHREYGTALVALCFTSYAYPITLGTHVVNN